MEDTANLQTVRNVFEGNGSGFLIRGANERGFGDHLPAQGGGLKYTFNYNAADHGSVPFPTPSYGWGEISSITFPSVRGKLYLCSRG